MQEYYSLLGVFPTATADEIEEAYQNKKREFAPERFEQGTAEWLRAFAALKELDKAYDQAIMATFAPIRAFADPLPPLPRPSVPQNKTKPKQAQPSVSFEPEVPGHPQAQSAPSVSYEPPRKTTLQSSPPYQSSYRPLPESFSEDSDFRGLVEEVPVSFSDAQLLDMDIQDLRESYAPHKEESVFFTLGIQDRLLRFYVKTYLAFVLFDLLMRVSLGTAWVAMSGALNHYSAFLMEIAPPRATLAETLATMPPTPLFMSAVASFISMFYLFCCSLPMPIVTRFFILGQPPEKGATRWMLAFLSIAVALILYSLTGFLFRFLPADWGGSGMNLIFVAPPLCLATMHYQGD
jgi:hypothetical protein